MAIDTDRLQEALLELVSAHMDAQPYQITYAGGAEVDYDSEVDSDGDLFLTISPPEHLIDRIEELETELEEAYERIKELEATAKTSN
jgi:hypothetical protein